MPIAVVAATLANIFTGRLDPTLSLLLTVGLVGGCLSGVHLADVLPAKVPYCLVELVLVGSLFALRFFQGVA
ncbi:hypothetical protein [Acidiphilium iwatense]|uniref:Membrane transporter protein n=1 Tax=Acidiphilium iwatense TaxID=768198 RepID=A0ABS9E166_9PROT|nr:hypothetical protein [Acidiphilium iwatense]MCF3948756.1 hypothetical protein [Acidiphilium iwatense]